MTHLEGLGYTIAARNYRAGRAEVDLVAWDGPVLVFVEVKTRGRIRFGRPASFLTRAQQRRIAAAAAHYAESVGHDWEVRFDVVSVVLTGPETGVEHLPDAFFPGLF